MTDLVVAEYKNEEKGRTRCSIKLNGSKILQFILPLALSAYYGSFYTNTFNMLSKNAIIIVRLNAHVKKGWNPLQ